MIDTTMTLAERYQAVRQRIADAANRAGRDPDSVILVAVTKYAEMEQIRELIELGHQDFGENRVQQLVQRAAMVEEYIKRRAALGHSIKGEARWHMIGHLQRNKAKKLGDSVRLVHSVDSLRLAEELQALGLRYETPVDVLVQVNVSGEESKYGCPIPATEPLAEAMESMAHLRVRGLMTMAPYTDNPEESRIHFTRLRELFEEMVLTGFGEGHFNILSMGMSGDYEVAVEEGANVVRVGSAIFGEPRNPGADENA